MKLKYLSILSVLLMIGGNIGSATDGFESIEYMNNDISQVPGNKMKLGDRIRHFNQNKGKINDTIKNEAREKKIKTLQKIYRNKPGGYLRTNQESYYEPGSLGDPSIEVKTIDVDNIPYYSTEQNSTKMIKGKTKLRNNRKKCNDKVCDEKAMKLDPFGSFSDDKFSTSGSDFSDGSEKKLPIFHNKDELKGRSLRAGLIMKDSKEDLNDINNFEYRSEFGNNELKKTAKFGNEYSDDTIDIKRINNLKQSTIRRGDYIYDKYETNGRRISNNEEYNPNHKFKTIKDLKTKADLKKSAIFD